MHYGKGGLECSYDVEKLGELANIYFREVVVFEFLEVAVVTHDISSPGNDGTVNKFIIVGVGSDKVEKR